LAGLSDDWLHSNEGTGTWSPFEVVGHLIVNEETNFLTRTLFILSEGENKLLAPLDMTAHITRSQGRTIDDLLNEFESLRAGNIKKLESLQLSAADLNKTARHPKIGIVSISQILSTWVAHDLSHLAQISRVMAKQYKLEVGPFIEFLTRLKEPHV
jgi:hypothetical protein